MFTLPDLHHTVRYLHLKRKPTERFAVREGLGAAAGAAAFHAAVAGAVAGHDRSAGGAAWAVAHVDHGTHRVGGVVDPAVFEGVVRCRLSVLS